MNIGRECKESNANNVFISSLIGRAQRRLNNEVLAVNNILKRVYTLKGLEFIDSSLIFSENLF